MVYYLIIATMVSLMTDQSTAAPTLTTKLDSSENDVYAQYKFNFIPRSDWEARSPKETNPLNVPVPYVVIHHSYQPPACYSFSTCVKAMKSMQNFHMDDRGWWDIGYHFAVGSDATAYEGRGWTTVGAHSLHFNTVSIGICLIGDWRSEEPPAEQIKTAKALIQAGVELGYIRPDYKLLGHRQVRDTECPGEALYQNIKTWEHYSPFPNNKDDLKDVPELAVAVKEKTNTTISS